MPETAEEYKASWVAVWHTYIQKKMADGYHELFGAPLNPDNPAEVLVAAYFLGQTDQINKRG